MQSNEISRILQYKLRDPADGVTFMLFVYSIDQRTTMEADTCFPFRV